MKKIKCILLVDDNKATNFLHETLIEDLDIAEQVAVAYNGRDGLAVLDGYYQKGQFPELIFVDIHMPVMDGFDFLEGYQARRYHERNDSLVIMLTTSTNPRDVQRVESVGFAGYLPKPLTEEQLLALAEKYLERSAGANGLASA